MLMCTLYLSEGTSLEIYVIIVSEGPLSWPTNLTFVLDGDISHTTYPNNSDSDTYQFRYDTLIFSNWSLSNAPHTFAMTAMQGWSRSVVLFDYATYTCVRYHMTPLHVIHRFYLMAGTRNPSPQAAFSLEPLATSRASH